MACFELWVALALPESHFLTARSPGRIILLSVKMLCLSVTVQKKVPNWRNLTFSNSTPSSLAPVSRAADPGLLCAGVAAVILHLPLPSSRRREALWIFATRRSLLYSILLKMASFVLLMKAGNNCQLLNNIPLMFIYHTSNEVSNNRADFCFNTEFYGMDSCN